MAALQFRTSVLTLCHLPVLSENKTRRNQSYVTQTKVFSPLAVKENLTSVSYYRGWIFLMGLFLLMHFSEAPEDP